MLFREEAKGLIGGREKLQGRKVLAVKEENFETNMLHWDELPYVVEMKYQGA